MLINLNGYKVIHSDRVFNALALMYIQMPDGDEGREEIVTKPKFLDVLAINEDGNVVSIRDEAWTFQFIPIVKK